MCYVILFTMRLMLICLHIYVPILIGVLQGLGTQTSLFVRHDRALRHFDDMVSQNLDAAMKKSGQYSLLSI